MSLECKLEKVQEYRQVDMFSHNFIDTMQNCIVDFAKALEFKRAILSKPIQEGGSPIVGSISVTEKYDDGFLPSKHIGNALGIDSIQNGLTFHYIEAETGRWTDAFSVGTKPITNLCANFSENQFTLSFFDYIGNEPEALEQRIQNSKMAEEILSNIPKFDTIYSDFLNFSSLLNIYVIEDQEMYKSEFRQCGAIFGNNIKIFNNGFEMMEYNSRQTPDVIMADFLTDITKNEHDFRILLEIIRNYYPCPVNVISGAEAETELKNMSGQLFDTWFMKPVNINRLILHGAKQNYDRAASSEIKNLPYVITGSTGSGKTELASQIMKTNSHYSLVQILSNRGIRKAEEGRGSNISLTTRDLNTLAKNGFADVCHLYGYDGTRNSTNYKYALLFKNPDTEKSQSMHINEQLAHELKDCHSLEETIAKGRIPMITMSGSNHLMAADKFTNPLIAELIYPVNEGTAFQIKRGSEDRILKQFQDIRELSQIDDERTKVYFLNRHLVKQKDGDKQLYALLKDNMTGVDETRQEIDSVEERMQILGKPFNGYAKMFSKLGFPKTTNKFYDKLIEYYISNNLIVDYDKKNIVEIENINHLIDYFHYATNKDRKVLFSNDLVEILDIQKMRARDHYVMVLGKSLGYTRDSDPLQSLAGFSPKIGYSPYELKKIRLNSRAEEILNNTLLMRYDKEIWSGQKRITQKELFPAFTGLNLLGNANYDLSFIIGTQLMIRDGDIENRPALTVVFSNNHKKGNYFAFTSPDDIRNFYEKHPKSSYFPGHFFRQVQAWDAESEIGRFYELGRKKYLEQFKKKNKHLFD